MCVLEVIPRDAPHIVHRETSVVNQIASEMHLYVNTCVCNRYHLSDQLLGLLLGYLADPENPKWSNHLMPCGQCNLTTWVGEVARLVYSTPCYLRETIIMYYDSSR